MYRRVCTGLFLHWGSSYKSSPPKEAPPSSLAFAASPLPNHSCLVGTQGLQSIWYFRGSKPYWTERDLPSDMPRTCCRASFTGDQLNACLGCMSFKNFLRNTFVLPLAIQFSRKERWPHWVWSNIYRTVHVRRNELNLLPPATKVFLESFLWISATIYIMLEPRAIPSLVTA